MNSLSVVLIGLTTVFSGLVLLIIVCQIMGFLCRKFSTGKKEVPSSVPAALKSTNIPNKPEVIAAIGAAIAEDLGTDVSGIRIKSIKKI